MNSKFGSDTTSENKDPIASLFNQKAGTWSKKYSSIFSCRLSAFESILKSIKGKDKILLDVGCATGDMLQMAHKLGFEVYGIDISSRMIDLCKKNLNSLISTEKIKCCNLEENTFQHLKFDVIICSSLYEYLKNPDLYLELFHKLLTANGTVLISIPNTKSLIRICEYYLKILFERMPFLVHLHTKFKNYFGYLQLSTNRPTEIQFCKITSEKKLIPKKKMYFGKNQISEHHNFFKSSMLLYLLEKVN